MIHIHHIHMVGMMDDWMSERSCVALPCFYFDNDPDHGPDDDCRHRHANTP